MELVMAEEVAFRLEAWLDVHTGHGGLGASLVICPDDKATCCLMCNCEEDTLCGGSPMATKFEVFLYVVLRELWDHGTCGSLRVIRGVGAEENDGPLTRLMTLAHEPAEGANPRRVM